MTDNKDTDPTLTPEWFASLLSRPSMRGTSAEMDERAIPRDTEGNPLPEAPGHRKELEEGLPVPVIDEFGTMSIECAKAIGTLIEGASDEPVESTAPLPSPVDPGLLEGLQFCLEDARDCLRSDPSKALALIGAALLNLEEIKEDQRGD